MASIVARSNHFSTTISTPGQVLRFAKNTRNAATKAYVSEPLKKFSGVMSKRFQAYKDSGWWHQPVDRVKVRGKDFYRSDGHRYVNMITNSYLMLNAHPRVVAAAKKALDEHNAISSGISAKLLRMDIHAEAEEAIAKYHKTEDAVLYSSLFLGNGYIESTVTNKDLIICDDENHVSLIYGVRLSKAKKLLYRHLDLEDLEAKLKEGQNKDVENIFIMTDGVFSMDGSIIDIIKMRKLADKYNALIVNDDCHSIGVLGETGKGTDEHYGVEGYSDIITNSTGKATAGSPGGYVCGTKDFMDYLRHHNRHYMMTSALSVSDYATIREAFNVLMEEPEHVQKLRKNIHYVKDGLLSEGFDITGIRDAGVFAVIIGSEATTSDIHRRLLQQGIACTFARFPGVARGEARLRLNVNVGISEEDMDKFVEAMVTVRKDMGGWPEILGDTVPITRGDPAKKLISETVTITKPKM